MKGRLAERLRSDARFRTIAFAGGSLIINAAYGIYNGILGITGGSLWFVNMCVYYLLLGSARFSAVLFEYGGAAGERDKAFVMRTVGALFIVIAGVMAGTVHISIAGGIAAKYHEIVMITMAAYTFYKLTMAVINSVKVRETRSKLLISLRRINCADAAVSLLSLQRSMIVSFGGMEARKELLLKSLSGAAVFMFMLVTGISMVFTRREKN